MSSNSKENYSLNDQLITKMEDLSSWSLRHGYPLSSLLNDEIEYYKKQFASHNERTEIISQIDDLNQYLEGFINKMNLIEGLEALLRKLKK